MVAKQVADLITFARGAIGIGLVWLGYRAGPAGLSLAVWMMLADWVGDMLDGRIARRSRVQYHTWIGDNDLLVDMFVSIGLLLFMLQAGFVEIWLAAGYLSIWMLYFGWKRGIPHSPGMLFQAPIYGWFIWVALLYAPLAGWAVVIYLAALILLTWPYFPNIIVPGFLQGLFHSDKK